MKPSFCDLSIYITTDDVVRMFSPGGTAEAEFAEVSAQIGFNKVYIECFRGVRTPLPVLVAARDFFVSRGIAVATGFMPVGADYSPAGRMICLSSPKTAELFDTMLSEVAPLFDELIVDDSFATDCTCPDCVAAKGEKSWSEFRRGLAVRFAAEHIIAPARKANPKINLTIKYPTWHESYQWLGYDLERESALFDDTYAGTETRHTSYSLFRNPRYTSYSVLRLLQSTPPHGCRGGWFDNIMCGGSVDVYLEQAELTLMASPREMTLFCWGIVRGTVELSALGQLMRRLEAVLPLTGEPDGLPVYLPYNSRGEDHVYDFLGMCGIPVSPTPVFPASGSVLITGASACDEDIVSKLKAFVNAGGKAVLTSGALRALQDRGMADCTALRVTDKVQTAAEFGGFEHDGWTNSVDYFSAEKPIALPLVEWMTNECVFCAMQIAPASPNVLLAYSRYGAGRTYLLNIPETLPDFSLIPAPVLKYVRRSLFAGTYIDAPGGIAFFPRTDGSFSLRSFLPHGAIIRVFSPLPELVGAEGRLLPKCVEGGLNVFELAIGPNALRVYKSK